MTLSEAESKLIHQCGGDVVDLSTGLRCKKCERTISRAECHVVYPCPNCGTELVMESDYEVPTK